jgi:hypothetical protein
MFFIPGFVISAVTFPGVIVHELAHLLFCRWTDTKVMAVCYFRFGNPAGYVVHEPATSAWQAILISMGPFFLNSLLAIVIGVPVVPKLVNFPGSLTAVDLLLAWVAISVGMHAIPSRGDARSMWSQVFHASGLSLAKIVVVPLAGLIYLLALGSVIWLDLAYGVAVVVALPMILVQVLA